MPEKTVFIDVELTKADKSSVVTLLNSPEEFERALSVVVEDGIRATVTLDKDNECYVCFLSPVSEKHAFNGYMVAARSGSPTKALAAAVFRHVFKFDRKWPIGQGKARRPTDD